MKRVFLGWTDQPFRRYIAALTALGARVERDDPAGCDALVLPGGADVHPRFYGQEIDGATDIDESRDAYELALFHRFFDAGLPILGVCRGAQLVNAALGGTLRQHIDGHSRVNGVDRVHGSHTDDAALRALCGERFFINSAHHQAVDRLGAGLRAVQWADDGTVEAIRHESAPLFAVQWHPERLHGADLGAETCDGWAVLDAFLKNTIF